jgi:hypothetical protein
MGSQSQELVGSDRSFPAVTGNVAETVPETVPETMFESVPKNVLVGSDRSSPAVTGNMPETVPETLFESVPENVPETVFESVPKNVLVGSDRSPSHPITTTTTSTAFSSSSSTEKIVELPSPPNRGITTPTIFTNDQGEQDFLGGGFGRRGVILDARGLERERRAGDLAIRHIEMAERIQPDIEFDIMRPFQRESDTSLPSSYVPPHQRRVMPDPGAPALATPTAVRVVLLMFFVCHNFSLFLLFF